MKKFCVNCIYEREPVAFEPCLSCFPNEKQNFIPKPMSNADKYFRNATDEEIAEIVVEDWCELLNCNCQMEKSLYRTCDGMCKERVLDWLKKEAKDKP